MTQCAPVPVRGEVELGRQRLQDTFFKHLKTDKVEENIQRLFFFFFNLFFSVNLCYSLRAAQDSSYEQRESIIECHSIYGLHAAMLHGMIWISRRGHITPECSMRRPKREASPGELKLFLFAFTCIVHYQN